jgi:hypothetical protein
MKKQLAIEKNMINADASCRANVSMPKEKAKAYYPLHQMSLSIKPTFVV